MTLATTLELPTIELIESYRELVGEFEAAGERLIPFPLSYSAVDGPAMIARPAAEARGKGLPPGFVAHSTFWLTQGKTVIAVSNLRHELTPFLRQEGGHIGYGVRPSMRGSGFGVEILRQTLARAAERGLGQVLLGCAATNLPSIRTILRNGGVLEADDIAGRDGVTMHRYWISLERGAV